MIRNYNYCTGEKVSYVRIYLIGYTMFNITWNKNKILVSEVIGNFMIEISPEITLNKSHSATLSVSMSTSNMVTEISITDFFKINCCVIFNSASICKHCNKHIFGVKNKGCKNYVLLSKSLIHFDFI